MKKINSFIRSNHKLLPPSIVIAVLLFAGSVAYAFSPQNQLVEKQFQTPVKAAFHPTKSTENTVPTPSITKVPDAVLGAKTGRVVPKPTASPTVSSKQESSTTTAQSSTGGTSGATSQTTETSTLAPTQQQPGATQAVAQTVSVEIITPNGSPKFIVEHHDGMNVCDVLQKAKDTGKISSVTFDDSYMSSLKSKYVAEINGFANNWTFSVNGTQPLGCSLAQPKPNDTIVWKFS